MRALTKRDIHVLAFVREQKDHFKKKNPLRTIVAMLFFVSIFTILSFGFLQGSFMINASAQEMTNMDKMDSDESEYVESAEILNVVKRETSSGQIVSFIFIKNTGNSELNHIVLTQTVDGTKFIKSKLATWDLSTKQNIITLHKEEKTLLPGNTLVPRFYTTEEIPTFEIKTVANSISRTIKDLDNAQSSETVELSDGEVFQLEAKPVVKNIDDNLIRMYSYNGQIPGPMLKVTQGSSIDIDFKNNLDIETTVHWHGIRVQNEFDGVPDFTQEPIMPGDSFTYTLDFPDEGIYWYHPHIRDEIGQELGLYGAILVEPTSPNYFNPVDEEVVLFLDDIKIENGDVELFSENYANFVLTGRFGNVMLVDGVSDYQLNVQKGDIIRFYLIDSSNTRTFNFAIEDQKMKLVGGDSGKYARESLVETIMISVSERYIVEVLFEDVGTFKIINKIPVYSEDNEEEIITLGEVRVSEGIYENQKSAEFYTLKENNEIISSFEPLKKYFDVEPDYQIDLTVETNMANVAASPSESLEPIEWDEDTDMANMNRMSTPQTVKWIMKDKVTGEENPNFQAKVGDIKKIRIFNDPNSPHPMQHPIHEHGQRFVVLNVDGKPNDNMVWKDTVLVPAGSTVDLLVMFTDPGEWLWHCHIPEHLEAGMTASFTVT